MKHAIEPLTAKLGNSYQQNMPWGQVVALRIFYIIDSDTWGQGPFVQSPQSLKLLLTKIWLIWYNKGCQACHLIIGLGENDKNVCGSGKECLNSSDDALFSPKFSAFVS